MQGVTRRMQGKENYTGQRGAESVLSDSHLQLQCSSASVQL
jgi:hypothetical protein